MRIKQLVAATAMLLCATAAFAQSTVTKPADQGPFWQPISNDGGTYVYSNSFVASEDGDPTELGAWLIDTEGGQLPQIRFEVWGDSTGPDAGNVLATTGPLDPTPVDDGSLECYVAPVLEVFAPLTNGQTYWFVATVVNEPMAPGSYQVGAHTQNSVYADNGTFWYSNDPAGVSFDGQNNTPEMAFQVEIDGGGSALDECTIELEPGTGQAFVPVPTLDAMGLGMLILLSLGMGMIVLRTRTA